jgi:hypothetical protein
METARFYLQAENKTLKFESVSESWEDVQIS